MIRAIVRLIAVLSPRFLLATIALAVVVGARAADLDADRLAGALRLREGYRGQDGRQGERIDQARLVDAIRQVEDWNGRDGRAGERGPYQITRAVWSQQMPNEPFVLARQEGPARACALKHVAWLGDQLRRAGWPDNAHTIALCYNAGLGRVLSGKAPMSSYDYALRAENLYDASKPSRFKN